MRDERSHVYKLFETVQGSARITSIAFESMLQLQLQRVVALTLVPMVKHLPTSGAKPHWRSQIVDELESMSTEDSGSVGAMAANRPLSIRFKPNETIEYRPSALRSVQIGTLYLPGSHQPAFNSFIVHHGVLYMFQITIEMHRFYGGVTEFVFQESLQEILQETEWYFIFVIPPGGEIDCLESTNHRSTEFWKKAKLFTAECDPTIRENLWLEE